jgi:hypothetical protein
MKRMNIGTDLIAGLGYNAELISAKIFAVEVLDPSSKYNDPRYVFVDKEDGRTVATKHTTNILNITKDHNFMDYETALKVAEEFSLNSNNHDLEIRVVLATHLKPAREYACNYII